MTVLIMFCLRFLRLQIPRFPGDDPPGQFGLVNGGFGFEIFNYDFLVAPRRIIHFVLFMLWSAASGRSAVWLTSGFWV